MEEKVYEAALRDDVASLVELLGNDPSILDTAAYSGSTSTPLHVAASLGHLSFFCEILRLKPDFASVVDRHGSLPLHIACGRGHVEMVRKLLSLNPNGSLAPDGEGRTPFEIAAAKGRAEVLCELVSATPSGVRIVTQRGETILHLCVKHNRLQALNQLLDAGEDAVTEIINFKDEDDNTLLHLAVAQKNAQMVKLLVRRKGVDLKATNLDGLTALDVLSYEPSTGIEKSIEKILKKAGVKRSAKAKKQRKLLSRVKKREKHEVWVMKTKGSLMIVAVLIATVTYQAGLSPPKGVLWQVDAGIVNSTGSSFAAAAPSAVQGRPQRYSRWGSRAAASVMDVLDEWIYTIFIGVNTVGFVSSLTIILMLGSGFYLARKLFVRVLILVTWLAIISMALTYSIALFYSTTHFPYSSFASVGSLLIIAGFLLLGHFIRLVLRLTWWLFRGMIRILVGLGNLARPRGAGDDRSNIAV
ncbi:hypothetical protein H6P81_008700 [Aristolochia fimbriata]|uniref:PGG domain-containing protein n=1 Tax=Aristolochia fimbriata TaxID=158543 RepID=A0AAV7EKX2_ARIFI|nr:hypothetical protein H6P81_008700 [Aristolochia fimbriata]